MWHGFWRAAIIAASVVFGTDRAVADELVWRGAAGTCVPTADTLAGERYVTTAGGVKFKPNATGAITFQCPLNYPISASGNFYFEAVVEMSNGFNSRVATHVAENLRIQLRNLQAGTQVQDLIGPGVSSGEQSSDSIKLVTKQSGFHSFNIDSQPYWIQFTLRRPSQQHEVVALKSLALYVR